MKVKYNTVLHKSRWTYVVDFGLYMGVYERVKTADWLNPLLACGPPDWFPWMNDGHFVLPVTLIYFFTTSKVSVINTIVFNITEICFLYAKKESYYLFGQFSSVWKTSLITLKALSTDRTTEATIYIINIFVSISSKISHIAYDRNTQIIFTNPSMRWYRFLNSLGDTYRLEANDRQSNLFWNPTYVHAFYLL